MVQDTEEFVPKVILVTGGAGFIGSHVAVCLTRKYPQYKVQYFPSISGFVPSEGPFCI